MRVLTADQVNGQYVVHVMIRLDGVCCNCACFKCTSLLLWCLQCWFGVRKTISRVWSSGLGVVLKFLKF